MRSNTKQPLVGVIDIGSNSVRLVVYDGLKRVPQILFNEKSTCQLGYGIDAGGNLNAEAKEKARQAITRFVYMARKMEVARLFAVATSAVRESEDGHRFVAELEASLGLEIAIISGQKEAELAALGVQASIHRPNGFSGDLGGGSFELMPIGDASGTPHSMQLGSLRLMDEFGHDVTAMERHITQTLDAVDWLNTDTQMPCFYAIGGGFRSIAAVHMEREDYPLGIIHYYTVEAAPFLSFIEELLTLSPEEWDALKGLSTRRVHSFLPSLLLLKAVIQRSGCAQVVFSSSGIREGLLFEHLPHDIQDESPLYASLRNIQHGEDYDTDYARRLEAWMIMACPSLALTAGQRHLLKALCLTGDISLPVHPEFRAEWAFEHIVQSNLLGITHRARLMLAVALYYRYRRKWKLEKDLPELLAPEDLAWAALAGSLAGFAFEISGGIPELLDELTLEVEPDYSLALDGDDEVLSILPATLPKRLEGLSERFSAFLSLKR